MNNANHRIPVTTVESYRRKCLREMKKHLMAVNQYRCELMLWQMEAGIDVDPVMAIETDCAGAITAASRAVYRREALATFLSRKALKNEQPLHEVRFRGVNVEAPVAGEPMEAWRIALEGHVQYDPNAAVVDVGYATDMVREKARRVNTYLGKANVERESVKLWSYELGQRVTDELASDFLREMLLPNSTTRTRTAGDDRTRARERFVRDKTALVGGNQVVVPGEPDLPAPVYGG